MSHKENDRPVGELYSRVYAVPTSFVDDSARARSRIGHFLYGEATSAFDSALAKLVAVTFGKEPPYQYLYDWRPYCSELGLNDFLTLVTLTQREAERTLSEKQRTGITSEESKKLNGFLREWLPFCRMVFRDEGLNYRIDERGGVHPLIDEEFQVARQALLAVLTKSRYRGALDHFETAHRHLAKHPPETRQAIWSMFQCVETLFQLLIVGKLNRGNIENKLVPKLEMAYPNDDKKSWKKLADSLSDWADAFHQYRHGQNDENPRTASAALCVYALSSGASFARLLAELDDMGFGLV